MAEPKAQADHIEPVLPWLLHWTIADERIRGFRSDAYAVDSSDGLLLIDALPLDRELQSQLGQVGALFLTHGSHQRSAWRLRAELGAPVYAPAGANGLDSEPDVWFDETTELPGGLRAVRALGFENACYLVAVGGRDDIAVFCGDLICQNPGGPYRFPVQEGYFDPEGGRRDAERLLTLNADALCAAHAVPTPDGCRSALEAALDQA